MKLGLNKVDGRRRRKKSAFFIVFSMLSMYACETLGEEVPNVDQGERLMETEETKGPSFDCDKASTRVERTICDYQYLSNLDRQLNNVYKQKRAVPELRDSVRKEQLDWLRNERAKCESSEGMAYDSNGPKIVACLRSVYLDRIRELNTISSDSTSSGEAVVPAGEEHKIHSGSSKTPIKFKLIEGKQYQLCRDYVDMLNQTGYTRPPVCERRVLSDFPKFRYVKWNEITDKERVQKVKKDQIMMEAMWPPGRRENAKKLWLSEKSKMDSGVYPNLHKADVDVDYDGVKNTVYRFSVFKPILEDYGVCAEFKSYFVSYDDEAKVEEAYGRPLGVVNTLNAPAGLNNLFYYDGRAFLDFWGTTYQYQLTVAEVGRGPMKQVCGINVTE